MSEKNDQAERERVKQILEETLGADVAPTDIDNAVRLLFENGFRLNEPTETQDAIVKLARQGLPYSQIAKQTGVTMTYAARVAKRAGVHRRDAPIAVQWTDEMRARLAGMRRAGISLDTIAAKLNIGRDAAHQECRRLGLVRPRHRN